MRRAGGLLAKRLLEAERLGGVVEPGGGAVRVDVEALLGLHAALLHGQPDGAGDAGSLGVGARDVIGVVGVAVAHELGIDVGAARDRVLPLLEDEHAGALAHDEAVALRVERAARGGGVGVGGEGAAAGEAGDGLRHDGRLGAAGENGVGVAVLDRAEGLAHGVGGGGAGGHDGQGGAERLVADGNVAGGHVGDHHRDHERGGAARTAVGDDVHVVGEGVDAAHARAHVDAQALAVDGVLGVEAGVGHRLVGGHERVLGKEVQVRGLLLAEKGGAVEVLDLGRDLDLEVLGVEVGDGADAALPRLHGLPGLLGGVAERRHGADAGDCNPVFHLNSQRDQKRAVPLLNRYIAMPPSTRMTSPVT